MNISPDVVRIKAEVKEARKWKLMIEHSDNKKRAKLSQDDTKCSLALENGYSNRRRGNQE
jgi:hypothetical protein